MARRPVEQFSPADHRKAAGQLLNLVYAGKSDARDQVELSHCEAHVAHALDDDQLILLAQVHATLARTEGT